MWAVRAGWAGGRKILLGGGGEGGEGGGGWAWTGAREALLSMQALWKRGQVRACGR